MTSYSEAEQTDDDAGTDQKLIKLLKQTPDIFIRYPELLTELELLHSSGDAISLIERQVNLLRDKLKASDNRLRELMNIAHDNERLAQSLHRLSINLLGAHDLEDSISIVLNELSNELKAEYAVIKIISSDKTLLEQEPERYVAKNKNELNEFSTMLKHNNPLCGRCSDEQKIFLFGENAELVGSAAVLPLVAGAELGLIGLASQDEERFNVSMGTDFLRQVAELVSASLAVHLE